MSNYIHPTMQPQPYRASYQQPPPPPRPAVPPSPSEPTDLERQMAKLDRKIRNSMVLIVIFVIFFILIGIVSVTVHEATYDGVIEKDRSEYAFVFSVDSATDSLPVKMEISASHKVEYFFLMTSDKYEMYKDEDEYDTRMTNYEQNSIYSVQDTTRFSLDKDLPVDEYVIVSAAQERSYSVSIEYKITRYYVQPVLIYILIIFILIWVVISFRIYKLHQQKQDLEYQDEQYGTGYQEGYYGAYGPPPAQPQAPRPPPQQTYYQQPQPQPQTLQAPPQGRVYDSSGGYPQPQVTGGPTPMVSRPPPRPRRRRPPPPPSPGATANPNSDYEPLVITCKCGGAINVDSPKRPVAIQCPECGRKGVVEAADDSSQTEGEEIHYF